MAGVITIPRSTRDTSLGKGTVVHRHGILPREKRRELFGIDIPDTLEWRNWQPGTEYRKNLVCKNVTTSTIKIKYKQTASKAFSMGFPEPIKLRPGMSCPLEVVFRPIKLQQYSDHIEIFVNDTASFIVLVEAYTPATHIQVPSNLSFGFVPCKELQQRPLTVINTGDCKVQLSWKLEAPFSIAPQALTLSQGSSHTFTVSFMPTEAGSFAASAACTVDGSGITSTTHIAGVAKFPYLSLEQNVVDFGEVVVGKSVERSIRFGNHSMVPANFTLSRDGPAHHDQVFATNLSSGTLGPEEFSVIRIQYTPKHTGTFTCETFTLSTPGGNRLQLVLKGTASAPKVTLSTRVINFGNVTCDSSSSRVLYLQNHSEVPVHYDFQVDALDCFTFSKPQGVINPGLTGHVTITFQTSTPANFWRRVACLIKDADPVGLDLMATSYTDKARPPPLEHRHVVSYLGRVCAGGEAVELDPATAGSIPPSPVPSGGKSSSRPTSAEAPGAAQPGDGDAAGGTGLQQLWAGPDSWQLLFQGQDPAKAVVVDTDTLVFGTCSRLTAAEHLPVTVTNNTKAKVTAFFVVPPWRDPGTGEVTQIFHVLPESVDIKAGGQATFRVAFRPSRDSAHVCQTLTLCAHVKSMRNFRLVPDSQVVPPWSIPLRAAGNTFLHSNPEFSPKVSISHTSISFPPCRVSEQVSQTLCLSNYGDTPASFAFTNLTALKPLFTIKPSTGVVPAKGHILVAVRFQPTNSRPVESKALLTLNNVSLAATEITLRGAGHTPKLVVDLGPAGAGPGATPVADSGAAQGGSTGSGSGVLFFRPTCVGASAQRTVTLRNPSRVPVSWQWQLPSRLEGVVEVSPASGVLRGSEAVPLTWTFAPVKQKLYEASVTCHLLHPDSLEVPTMLLNSVELTGSRAGSASDSQSVGVRVVGEGTASALALEPPTLDIGDIKVGHPVKRTVRLVNQSDGTLRYLLDCAGAEDDAQPEPGADPVEFVGSSVVVESVRSEELWVDETEGTIAARATKDVTITFFPRYRKHYHLQLRCRSATLPNQLLRQPSSSGPGAVRLPPLPHAPGPRSPDPTATPGEAPAGPRAPTPPVDLSSSVAVVCPVTARATFPSLRITDVLRDGVSKQVLWSQLGLPAFNTELASGVTTLELDLEKMENKGSLTTDRACAALMPFRLDFGCLGHGAAPSIIYVQVTNPTPLPVHWELHSYDDPDLELENWVEPGRPRNELERARDHIAENKIFELSPREGHLGSNASQLVAIQYRPSHVGQHEFPMFLRVADGKRMQLQLAGSTVAAPAAPKLALTPMHRTFTLPPTPIGAIGKAPLHVYLLRNGAPCTCSFQVDLSPLQALSESNYNYPVLHLASPREGTMQEGGAAALTWQFTPVEAKVYSVTIPVHLSSTAHDPDEAGHTSSLELITLQGRGYHPVHPDTPEPLPGEGNRESSSWSGFSPHPSPHLSSHRLLLPSHDALSLGTTLPGGRVRRITVLTNTSPYPVLYGWDLAALGPAHTLAGGHLDISPHSGRLQPGERAVVRLTFTAPLVPLILEGEVRCDLAVDEEAVWETVESARATAAAAAAAARVELTETGSVVEEVVAKHPGRGTGVRARTRHIVSGRLPVHLAMTGSMTACLPPRLGDQWQKTLDTYRKRGADEDIQLDLPPPQILTLSLTGRVLTRDQITQGHFIPAQEHQAALDALESTAWVPPTTAPFFAQPLQSSEEAPADSNVQHAPVVDALLPAQLSEQQDVSGGPTSGGQSTREASNSPQQSERASGDAADAPEAQAPEAQADTEGEEGEGSEPGDIQALSAQLKSLLGGVVLEPTEQDEDIAGSGQGGEGGEEVGGLKTRRASRTSDTDQGDDEEAGEDLAVAGSDMDITLSPGVQPRSDGSDGHLLETVAEEASKEHQPHTPIRTPDAMGGTDTGADVPALLSAAAAAAAAAVGEEGGDMEGTVDPWPTAAKMEAAKKPLAKVGAPQLPTAKQPTAEQTAHLTAGLLLRQVLQQVLDPARDPDVAAALQCLRPKPLPAFCQLMPQTADSAQAGVPAPSCGGQEAVGAEQGVGQCQDQKSEAEGDLSEVFRDPVFQELAEYVLSSTVVGLMEECAADEWEAPGGA